MGSRLVLSETLSGAGTSVATVRLAKFGGRTAFLQIDTDGTLLLGAITLEARNTHAGAVGGGGWIDVTSLYEPDALGADLASTQGTKGYNFSFLGSEQLRISVPYASGAGDVSVTLHSVA